MNHDILLKDGSILRFVSLGGHCVHITHGADGQGIGSGMNRYGIIDEKPLKEDPSQVVVCDNGFELADGCLLRIDPPNKFTIERDGTAKSSCALRSWSRVLKAVSGSCSIWMLPNGSTVSAMKTESISKSVVTARKWFSAT